MLATPRTAAVKDHLGVMEDDHVLITEMTITTIMSWLIKKKDDSR